MANYWQITKWDGETIRVRPDNVEAVKTKMGSGEGHIITRTFTIAVKDIKTFEETDVAENPPLLLAGNLEEEAAKAFKEPILDEGGIRCRAVKKLVPRRMWDRYYAPSGYKRLSEDDNAVWIAWWQPVHLMTPSMYECTAEEARLLG